MKGCDGKDRITALCTSFPQLNTAALQRNIYARHEPALCCLVGPHVGRSKPFQKEGEAPVRTFVSPQVVKQHLRRPVFRVIMDMLLNFLSQTCRLT